MQNCTTRLIFGVVVLIVSASFSQVHSQQNVLQDEGPHVIHIAGVFTRRLSAGAEAVRLAVKDINAHNSSRYFNVRLNLSEDGETLCKPSELIRIVTKLMAVESGEIKKSVILAGCHEDCQLIANQLSLNAVTFCYGISNKPESVLSDILENDELPNALDPTFYPTFTSGLFILQPTLSAVTLAYSLLDLFQYFHWRKVAILHKDVGESDDFGFQNMGSDLSNILSGHGLEVLEPFSILEDNLSSKIKLIKEMDYRIILVLANERETKQILCHIYRHELYDVKKYVWIFIGFPPVRGDWTAEFIDENIHQVDCKPEQLLQATNGHFYLSLGYWRNPSERVSTLTNKGVRDFRREMYKALQESGEHIQSDFDEAPLAYDAVWAAYTMFITSFIKCQNEGVPLGLCDILINDSFNGFTGLSGYVSFHEGKRSNRRVNVKIERFNSQRYRYDLIAWYFNGNKSFTWTQPSPFGNSPPGDGFVNKLPGEETPNSGNNFRNLVPISIICLFVVHI